MHRSNTAPSGSSTIVPLDTHLLSQVTGGLCRYYALQSGTGSLTRPVFFRDCYVIGPTPAPKQYPGAGDYVGGRGWVSSR